MGKFESLYESILEKRFSGSVYDAIDYAHEYKSPRQYDLTPAEEHVRDVSYSIKKINSPHMKEAGKDMSAFVKSGDILVPIPSSKGDTSVNLKLAASISKLSGASVEDVLGTKYERESNLVRSKNGLPRLKGEDMALYLKKHIKDNNKIVFIDNVATTGSSIKGAMNLINGGRGLVYAKDLSSSVKY